MPSFVTAKVQQIILERRGLQRVVVQREQVEVTEKAYVLTEVIGPVRVGDDVVINTTAVDLQLGTGGWHPVQWNLSRDQWVSSGPGHVMKMRYSGSQIDAGAVEEAEDYEEPASLDGTPVVACLLHSHIAAVAASIRLHQPQWKIAYVMTDQAALPFPLSDLAYELVSKNLLDMTISAGQAFGAQFEAVNVSSALGVAKSKRADVIIVSQGPGVVGTATKRGFSALECAAHLTSAAQYGGRAILALRYSNADPRPRHHGLSHHSVTVLENTPIAVEVGVPPCLGALNIERHHAVPVAEVDVESLLADYGLTVTSMGRPSAQDPMFFAAAAAAGTLASRTASNVRT